MEWVNNVPRNHIVHGKSVPMNYFDGMSMFNSIIQDGIAWESVELYSTNKFTGKKVRVCHIAW